jgi:thiosulfate/3-mercaptopyruvate sulfurtransferase
MMYNPATKPINLLRAMLPLIISPETFKSHLDDPDLLIIDICREENYVAGHIPGAIHIAPSDLVAGVKPATGKLPGIERLNALFSAIGYAPDKQIVVYDDEGGGWAGRFVWTLDVIGHVKTAYLDGGLPAWIAAGLPLTTKQPAIMVTHTNLQVDTRYIAEKEDVLASISDPETLIWDARSVEEYAGTKILAARGGHVPGAVNLDWLDTMDSQNNLKLMPNLQELLDSRGLTRDKSIITHCQTHHRSGLTYLIGKMLGYPIRAYHGSWSEWGNDPDMPIEI